MKVIRFLLNMPNLYSHFTIIINDILAIFITYIKNIHTRSETQRERESTKEVLQIFVYIKQN